MSAVRLVRLRCDGQSCEDAAFPVMTPPAPNAVLARARSARQGWHYVGAGRDICPSCWAEGHR